MEEPGGGIPPPAAQGPRERGEGRGWSVEATGDPEGRERQGERDGERTRCVVGGRAKAAATIVGVGSRWLARQR